MQGHLVNTFISFHIIHGYGLRNRYLLLCFTLIPLAAISRLVLIFWGVGCKGISRTSMWVMWGVGSL
jgi:hypothetical protein